MRTRFGMDAWARRVAGWPNRATGRQAAAVALFALAALIIAPAVMAAPAVFFVVLLFAALALFARAWAREFLFLMDLDDDAFPGRNDKSTWALLLILIPPVGLYAFHSYRLAHWSPAKPAGMADDLI